MMSYFLSAKTTRQTKVLRLYQKESIKEALYYLKRGVTYALCLPAQTGKTFTFMQTAKVGNFITLFVTPRKFITNQGANEALDFFKEDEVFYLNSKSKNKDIENISKNIKMVVGDLKTVINRIEKGSLEISSFTLLAVDEAHYSSKEVDTLRRKMKHCKQLGITATPYNSKGVYFDSYDFINDRYSPKYMVENKFLAKLLIHYADVFDKSSASREYYNKLKKGVDGEYTSNSMTQATNSKAGKIMTELVLDFTLKNIVKKKKRYLVYAGSIEQCNRIVEEYKRNGLKAIAVHSKAKDSLRLVDDFNGGVYDILISVDMLVMGVVVKNVKESIFFRGVSSRITYTQISNRGRGGDFNETKYPVHHWHFTNTPIKMGHPDDFIPTHQGETNGRRAVLKCKKCEVRLSEFPPKIIREICEGSFLITEKKCIVCDNIFQSKRSISKIEAYQGSFNMLTLSQRQQIEKKVKTKKIDNLINEAIKNIEHELKEKGIKSEDIVDTIKKDLIPKLSKNNRYLADIASLIKNHGIKTISKELPKLIKGKQ